VDLQGVAVNHRCPAGDGFGTGSGANKRQNNEGARFHDGLSHYPKRVHFREMSVVAIGALHLGSAGFRATLRV